MNSPHIIVGDRQTGKTHKLIDWLCEGRKTDRIPGWSRVIICTIPRDKLQFKNCPRLKEIDHPNPQDLIFSLNESYKLKGLEAEIAVDDAQEIIYGQFRQRISVIAINGSSAEFLDPNNEIDTLRSIVFDLATETKAPVELDNGHCTICGGYCAESNIKGGTDGHIPECAYRRAVEYKNRRVDLTDNK